MIFNGSILFDLSFSDWPERERKKKSACNDVFGQLSDSFEHVENNVGAFPRH